MTANTPAASTRENDMAAYLDLRLGTRVSLQAYARTTPSGLASIGLLVSIILLSTAVLVREAKRRF